MSIFFFKPQFVPKVLDGSKPFTIRPTRKHPVPVGNRMSLRRWTGRPYHSPPEEFATAILTLSHPIIITDGSIFDQLTRKPFTFPQAEAIAKADGFDDATAFFRWLRAEHGEKTFIGDLYGFITVGTNAAPLALLTALGIVPANVLQEDSPC